ncbi:MAG: nuclear transport factor 2 family protein [Pseudomonadota bacterium]|nr:nuclear transport factor 2 family protein [Pseudomonadota bacterium]
MLTPTDFVQEWLNVMGSNEPSAIVTLYKEDAVLLGTLDDKMRKGTKSIREYFDYFVTLQPRGKITQIVCDETGSGAVVIANGFYDLQLYHEDKITNVRARFTFVLERGVTNWKILSHHSSEVPLT